MKKSLMVAALFQALVVATGTLSPAFAQYFGGRVYAGNNYGSNNTGTGTSYSPNYQFNNPGNMMRLNAPYANQYNYGSPYGMGMSPYGMGMSPYGYSGGYYGAPTLLGGNSYGFSMGGQNYNMWRGPSGYYYPWMYNNTSTTVTQMPMAMSVANGNSQAAQPPIHTMLTDMINYLDTQHKDNKLDDAEFQSLKRRALDLQSKYQEIQKEQEGVVDTATEQQMRADVNALGAEVSHRVKP